MTTLRCILVPFDFIDPSRRACDFALELAANVGAGIVLVHVVEPSMLVVSHGDHALIDGGAADALERTARLLRPHLRRVDTRIVEGEPWAGIDAVAVAVRADLVVMGNHGRRGLARALLGSVSAQVARTSPVPVTLVGEYVATSRNDAGVRLAADAAKHALTEPLVVALSRGALTIATSLAGQAEGPIDLWCVQPVISSSGVVIGAVAEDGALALDVGADEGAADEAQVAKARQQLRDELAALRGQRPAADCAGRDVVVVADGLFSAAFARVAVDAMRTRGARKVLVASPVVERSVFRELEGHVDAIVALERATIAETCRYRDDVLPSDLVARELLLVC